MTPQLEKGKHFVQMYHYYQNEQQQEGRQDECGESVGNHRGGLLLRLPEQMLRTNEETLNPAAFQHQPVNEMLREHRLYLYLWFGHIKSLGLNCCWGLLIHELQDDVGLSKE